MSPEAEVRFRTTHRPPDRRDGPPIVRLSHPLAFAALLKRTGAPWQRYFRAAKLPVHAENPDLYVTARSAWASFDRAAKRESEDFGWWVGQFVGENNISEKLLQQTEHAPTLYVGLKELVRLISSESSDLGLGIEEREDDILLYTHYPNMRSLPGYLTAQAYQLPVFLAFIRHYLGSRWSPDEVGVEAKRTPKAAETCFAGAHVRTGQERGYIRLPRDVLNAPAPDALELQRVPKLARLDSLSFDNRLRLLLRPYRAEGIPSKQFAADLIETSPRTMTRRLAASRTNFRRLLDELHFNAAKDLLQGGNLSIRETASRIGYDNPSHFARMFRRIGGVSPRTFRKISQEN